MAKQISAIRLQGTFQDITYVNSSAYGNHIRAKRGTHKPAPVNERLQEEGNRTLMANVPAKIFKDAVDPYRDISDGRLWQRLVSVFRKQLKENGKFDFSELKLFDIYDKHPLSRLFAVQPVVVTPDEKKAKLEVEMRPGSHPEFKKVKNVDGYKLTLIGVFPDLKKKTAATTLVTSPVLSLKKSVTPLVLHLDIPLKAKEYIICLKVFGCQGGVATDLRATIAFAVIAGGKI